ncbi:hypothetical protein N7493_008471 [Penicillium malachiteum]|uniref:Uncharacterized protein n=1 Tax=Penicillium malachiteum TaxID=1324776 RepID=A0AAD6MTZ7_9EURO|nr:hypothetical protein N7493_008471 [Penicillium malachiteum]
MDPDKEVNGRLCAVIQYILWAIKFPGRVIRDDLQITIIQDLQRFLELNPATRISRQAAGRHLHRQ